MLGDHVQSFARSFLLPAASIVGLVVFFPRGSTRPFRPFSPFLSGRMCKEVDMCFFKRYNLLQGKGIRNTLGRWQKGKQVMRPAIASYPEGSGYRITVPLISALRVSGLGGEFIRSSKALM
jgi:hypothetical protein